VAANSFADDDKLSTSGGTMTGTLTFLGTPPFTVAEDVWAGVVTLNGTTAVVVSTAAPDAESVILLTVQPATAPVGIPYVSAVSPGSSFSVKSTSASDTAVICGWFIVESAP
jgi:hypothetical protein